MGKVKANPETLNDVGNRMLTTSRDLTAANGDLGEHGTFDRASLGQATVGVMISETYADVVAEMSGVLENFALITESDGSHIQRASRDIDEVLNRRKP
jgi:hypothetical protein